MNDEGSCAEIGALVASQPVVIADGHHRYETAVRFREECRASNGDQPGDYDAVMTFVVELSGDELVVEPVHRLINGLSSDVDVVAELSRHFRVEPAPDEPAALSAAMHDSAALGLVTPKAAFLLIDAEPPGLDAARLDKLLKKLPAHQLTYDQRATDAFAAVRSGSAQAAILVKPASVEQIAEAAHQRTTMPPKTTYFAPKPRTGMVFRKLDV